VRGDREGRGGRGVESYEKGRYGGRRRSVRGEGGCGGGGHKKGEPKAGGREKMKTR